MNLPLIVLVGAMAVASDPSRSARPAREDGPTTFTRDIAPIVYGKCVSCHRAGEAAPFPLTRYEEVKRRAREIAEVTQKGFMPPWLPESGHVPLRDDRSLSPEEVEVFQRWTAAGAPRGEPAPDPDLPAAAGSGGWRLGEPDLVLEMDTAYTVPAEGRDVYRCFVLPAPNVETRWVRAVEFQPDNRSVVHHCVLYVDGSGAARAEDARSAEAGYPGMSSNARIPDGQFLGWTPGKLPDPGQPDIAWRLDPHTDVVLQLHLRPTGKPERVRVRLGLFFAEGPPARRPLAINLWSRALDIPAGERAYRVESSYVLPVDVQVLGVWPHAHYLGKDLTGYAELPDGSTRTLIHIPDWDFNWQEEYVFAEPVRLPAGTRVGFRYLYDNSEANLLNPNQPPRRVVYGSRSDQEMAELHLQLLPATEERPILFHDYLRHSAEQNLAYFRALAEGDPRRAEWQHQIGTFLGRLGRTREAVAIYEGLAALRPGRAFPETCLGEARLEDGDVDGAIEVLQRATARPDAEPRALALLGRAHLQRGEAAAGLELLRRAVERAPADASVLTDLAAALRAEDVEAARSLLSRARAANPESIPTLALSAELALEGGELGEARRLAENALDICPDDARALVVLGCVCRREGREAEAERLLGLGQRFDPAARPN